VKVAVTNPDIKGRREILVLYLSKIKHDSSVDIEKLAKMTVGGQSLVNLYCLHFWVCD
jgi:ATP-dependent Zn protease